MLAGGFGEFAHDLTGVGTFERPSNALRVTSQEGWSRWRFTLWEFEQLSSVRPGDLIVAAAGQHEALLDTESGEHAGMQACYISKPLRDHVNPYTVEGSWARFREPTPDLPPVVLTEQALHHLRISRRPAVGAVLSINGANGILTGILREGALRNLACGEGVFLRLEDSRHFSPDARDLSSRTQWLSLWVMDGGNRMAASSEIRSILERTLLLRSTERLNFVPGWRASIGRSRQVWLMFVLLSTAVALFAVLTAINSYLLVGAILTAREREIGIAVALGGTTWAIARGQIALLVPLLFAGLLLGAMLTNIPLLANTVTPVLGSFGSRRLSTAAAIATLSCVLVVISSVIAVRRRVSAPNLLQHLHQVTMASGGSRNRRLLAITQLAICALMITMTVGITLSVRALFAVSPNFDAATVILLEPIRRARDTVEVSHRQIEAQLSNTSGLRYFSHLRTAPFSGAMNVVPVFSSTRGATAQYNEVGAQIVRALGLTLHSGRDLASSDEVTDSKVALLSRSAAVFLFGSPHAVGQSISIGPVRLPHAVVGVFEDPKFNTLRENDALHVWVPRPLGADQTLVLRAFPIHTQELIQSVMSKPIGYRVAPMSTMLNQWLRGGVVVRDCLALACAIVLLSSLVTVYTYASEEILRYRPVAALLASLGARAHSIVFFVGRRVHRDVLVGAMIGSAAALVLARFLPQLIFGVGDFEWIALTVGAMITIGVFLLILPRLINVTRIDYSLLSDLR